MKRPFKIIAAFALGLFISWWFLKPRPPSPPPAPVSTRPKADLLLPTPRVPSPTPRIATTKKEKTTSPFTVPPDAVAFEVHDGLALAFGDIVLGKPDEPVEQGFFVPPPVQLWDSAEIPYAIDDKITNPEQVEEALAFFQKQTRVRFVPFQDQADAIVFVPGEKHCYSYVGKVRGHQPIYLSPHCGPQQVAHELMHALGFVHEQSRSDRDRYVEVLTDNIQPDYLFQFARVPETLMETVKGSAFDYGSIMLYEPNAFAVEKSKPTLRGKNGNQISPVKNGLSRLDAERVNDIYGGI